MLPVTLTTPLVTSAAKTHRSTICPFSATYRYAKGRVKHIHSNKFSYTNYTERRGLVSRIVTVKNKKTNAIRKFKKDFTERADFRACAETSYVFTQGFE